MTDTHGLPPSAEEDAESERFAIRFWVVLVVGLFLCWAFK